MFHYTKNGADCWVSWWVPSIINCTKMRRLRCSKWFLILHDDDGDVDDMIIHKQFALTKPSCLVPTFALLFAGAAASSDRKSHE
jgi:hypothetical protein